MNINSKKRIEEGVVIGSASLTSSDNASTTQRKAHKASASATWCTSSWVLEIAAVLCALLAAWLCRRRLRASTGGLDYGWSSRSFAAAVGSMMLDQICSSGATARSGMA